jgi:hypothetical protein
MWIEGEISRELEDAARTFPALVLIGPRQVGKTSVLGRCFPEHRYVSLDDPAAARMADESPGEFLERHPPPLIVDEVQYAPGLFRRLKSEIDGRAPARGLFVLTGSESFGLMREVSDSLAGRAAVLPLLGLSAEEWARSGVSTGVRWQEFVWRGGFPALWADGAESPRPDRWYQGYLASYLERDVRNLSQVGSLRDFDRFLRACAARTAQTLNMSDIARDVGVTVPTVKSWLSVLQASNQIVLLAPYHRSLGKRIVKAPRLHFTDTGLAAFLLGYQGADGLLEGPLGGPFWESHVVGQWLRWRDWRRPAAALWYWRDQGGAEVDLLVELDGRLHAIECKLTSAPTERDLRGIVRLRAVYGPQVASASIACTATLDGRLGSDVRVVPGFQTFALG